ncbi:hypothetical protein [Arenibacterium sp. LLYu02]|uniref:hypothetical protein n=1 Tax=Arenibacterium sp. LLYu02 TaxID=3404132 RepID=UPI003B21160F
MALPSRRSVVSLLCASALLVGCTISETQVPEADFFSARTKARIYALDGKTFEVVPPIGAEAPSYWCAASEFARRELGADWSQMLYVKTGRAPSVVTGRIEAITFTLNEVPRDTPQPLIRRSFTYKPGDSASVSVADASCRDLEPFYYF